MDKIILGFVSKLAAGKTTVCQYLAEKYRAEIFTFSTPLRDVLDRFNLPHTRQNMQAVSQGLREALGQDILARVLADDAVGSKVKLVCVDGVRRPKDLEYLKKLNNFHLIFVAADQKLRWQRITGRKQNPGEDNWTFVEFKQREAAEAESLIDEVAREAKFKILNNGTVEELYEQIEKILTELGIVDY